MKGGGPRQSVAALLLGLSLAGACAGCGERSSRGASAPRPVANGSETVANDVEPKPERVSISGEIFELELAVDPIHRARGLMYRREIPDHGGMLFVSPAPARQEFWMGWCLVDLDIIFLDERGRVTALHRMRAEPPQRPGETEEAYRARMPLYSSRLDAQFVIELKSGTLDRLTLDVGDTIDLDLARLRALAH